MKRHSDPLFPDRKFARSDDYRARGRGRGPYRGELGGRGRGRFGGYGEGDAFPVSVPQHVGQLAEEPILVQELPLRKHLASALIGIGGETVARIRRESRCKIHVRKTSADQENQVVELRGTSDEVETAIARIRDLCAELEPSYMLEVPALTASYVPITPDMVGCVIGRAGQNVKTIRQSTGAAVRVEELEPGADVQLVSIRGNIEQVRMGYTMVRDLLEKFDPYKVRHRPGMEQGYHGELVQLSGSEMAFADASQLDAIRPGQAIALDIPSYGLPSGTQQYATQLATPNMSGSTIMLSGGVSGGSQSTPTILVLQPDGTYKPAQVLMYQMPSTQNLQGMAQPQQILSASGPMQNMQQLQPPTTLQTGQQTQVSLAQAQPMDLSALAGQVGQVQTTWGVAGTNGTVQTSNASAPYQANSGTYTLNPMGAPTATNVYGTSLLNTQQLTGQPQSLIITSSAPQAGLVSTQGGQIASVQRIYSNVGGSLL